jgi:hypothetical protein
MVNVLLLRVALGRLPQGVSVGRLEFVEVGEERADLHAFSTCTAAVLKRGCFETGSQSVIVSSFAARGRSVGPALSSTSQ